MLILTAQLSNKFHTVVCKSHGIIVKCIWQTNMYICSYIGFILVRYERTGQRRTKHSVYIIVLLFDTTKTILNGYLQLEGMLFPSRRPGSDWPVHRSPPCTCSSHCPGTSANPNGNPLTQGMSSKPTCVPAKCAPT